MTDTANEIWDLLCQLSNEGPVVKDQFCRGIEGILARGNRYIHRDDYGAYLQEMMSEAMLTGSAFSLLRKPEYQYGSPTKLRWRTK